MDDQLDMGWGLGAGTTKPWTEASLHGNEDKPPNYVVDERPVCRDATSDWLLLSPKVVLLRDNCLHFCAYVVDYNVYTVNVLSPTNLFWPKFVCTCE